MDVLADLLGRAHARGALFAHSELRGAWGIELVDADVPLSVHAVLAGELWAQLDGGPPVHVLQGDLLLVHSERPYRFTHAPGAPARPLVGPARPRSGAVTFTLPGDEAPAVLLCGAYRFQGTVCDGLLAALPELVALPAAVRTEPALRTVLDLVDSELRTAAAGRQTLLDRLLDLLLVYSLRTHFATLGAGAPSWYRAFDDPAVGAAVRALHADPAHAWTVAALAARAGLSRAALARRFTARTGRAPLAYLTAWRMTLARDALLRPGATLAAVAHEIGYGSEFAFAAAFKREEGVAPGRWRDERLAAAS